MVRIFKSIPYLFSVIVILSVSASSALAQGHIEIISDFQLKLLENKSVIRADTTKTPGYRIQIYFGNNMKEAQKIHDKCKMLHPVRAAEVYMHYYTPYWRVRFGNYYREIDAQADMKMLEKEFGSVFLVKDNIELPPLYFQTAEEQPEEMPEEEEN